MKSVICYMKMQNGRRSVKSGVLRTILVILRSRNTQIRHLNYPSHRCTESKLLHLSLLSCFSKIKIASKDAPIANGE